jgi:hypothetical protein
MTKEDKNFLLLWVYTILAVPIFIIVSFWLTGYLGFSLF